ncbi:hypothetical protein EVAR_3632_1 [Eumeta japonica]|uniref:Uncharacterized protein n=1 Tax=Eumeta variegata TaxID=151549 RepID=A0A4C1SYQ2_EUMVA|nr:hypothetical protein EVAR_3632_1 [Eumeta japonica]
MNKRSFHLPQMQYRTMRYDAAGVHIQILLQQYAADIYLLYTYGICTLSGSYQPTQASELLAQAGRAARRRGAGAIGREIDRLLPHIDRYYAPSKRTALGRINRRIQVFDPAPEDEPGARRGVAGFVMQITLIRVCRRRVSATAPGAGTLWTRTLQPFKVTSRARSGHVQILKYIVRNGTSNLKR